MRERVLYKIANLEKPHKPFAVLAIYPDRPKDGGCVAIVHSVHDFSGDAERELATLTKEAPDDPR